MDLSKTFTHGFAIRANKTEGFKTTTTVGLPGRERVLSGRRSPVQSTLGRARPWS
ncbi:hypothetical protein ABT300_10920 [Streptomyces sp. NPDC001027]|uniref:hypothetical protein n=1 Tax=Streptomyces sp. NPDC001027 TaxID=3154771 RepID=UPI003329042C